MGVDDNYFVHHWGEQIDDYWALTTHILRDKLGPVASFENKPI